jgi:hypothetical protein
MDREQMVREMVAAYTAPMIAECERMRAGIDRALPIILDSVVRDAEVAQRNQWRHQVERLLNELHGVEERVLQLADERFPQWRA